METEKQSCCVHLNVTQLLYKSNMHIRCDLIVHNCVFFCTLYRSALIQILGLHDGIACYKTPLTWLKSSLHLSSQIYL